MSPKLLKVRGCGSLATLRLNGAKELETEADKAKPYSEIPGPKPLPCLGNTWRFVPFLGDFKIHSIDKLTLKLFREYGSIVKVGGLLGRPDMVFLYDANEIERVFRNEELMPHRPSMPSLNYYKHVLRKDFFGDMAGVIAVHGQNWYNFRTKVQQPMLQPRTAKLYVNTIEETAEAFIQRTKLIRNDMNEVPADYLNEIHKWSLESLAKIALDVRLGCLDEHTNPEAQELIDAVVGFFQIVPILELKAPFWRIFSTPTWKKYIKSLDTIKSITMKHIDNALAELKKRNVKDVGTQASLLQRILAMDNNNKVAATLAFDMFLVGIDTTSTAVASILYQLSKHPNVQENLYREISSLLPPGDNQLTSQKLESMSYLRAVIKETLRAQIINSLLRMYPVVIGNGRTMTKDTIICGYHVPKGVQVVFQHFAISNSRSYFCDPWTFLPERWLKTGDSDQARNFISELKNNQRCTESQSSPCKGQIHPFASLPFGYGRRMCLGRRFAELEIQTVIAKLVQSFQIEYHHGELDYYIHPMYTPNGPLSFRLIDRMN
ncbi:hypothetical protein RUM43_006656 [Polyplax serrata]|uniref:Cytochrome P450 n=1 Tax=Polyplax serrata TaxID=468196 RepID=A0AAN8PD04_POLSC